ncbi:MAG: formate dehydrogenase accessory sulfurtransferase FdhD [Dehalococcoidia bacterium]
MEQSIKELPLRGVTPDINCNRFSTAGWESESVAAPSEMRLTIYADDRELVTLPCTPARLTELVFGALFFRGLIDDKRDVAGIDIDEGSWEAHVSLSKPGDMAGVPQGQKIDSNLKLIPAQILSMMRQLNERAEIYNYCGGVHTSALGCGSELVVVAEDISRHSTIDKIMGQCLLEEIPTRDNVLLTTGRISSETMWKALRMGVPIAVSRGSLTDCAISLAQDRGMTLVGYARNSRLSVYAHQERLNGALDRGYINQ